jgi:hypothetical protein
VRLAKLRKTAVATAAVAIASVAVLGSSPSARATEARATPAAAFLSVSGKILAVAAISPSNAWAVGFEGYLDDDDAQMLIAHWNGRRWSLVPNLPIGEVTQISMDSANDAWAVADDSSGEPYVIHWNGKTWRQDTTVPPVAASLDAVVAVDGQVWVSGSTGIDKNGRSPVVMLHRTHSRWYVVPVPGTTSGMDSFAAISPTNIWAGGSSVLHWNGAEWKLASPPRALGQMYVDSMAAGPRGSAWAVAVSLADPDDWFSLRWTGKAWTKVLFPRPTGEADVIGGIVAIPGGTDWVVGNSLNGNATKQVALILRWSGKAWQTIKTPATAFDNVQLYDVTATSPRNAWAVGVGTCLQEHCPVQDTFILHWNGKAWAT